MQDLQIIGSSEAMQEVKHLIMRACSCDSNVIILGESGTGKELVAKQIHYYSLRKDYPFIPINCTAIPDTLLEAELFGYHKGAFTGASTSKQGLFELANAGTVFLDEIADVSAAFQSKVLRLIQEREFFKLGGKQPVKVDVRIIAATNKNIAELVSRGLFREDLFYRLNVINIHLPPLRNRPQDIVLLCEHFIKKHASKRIDLTVKGLSHEALSALMRYQFPGNVRELENIIERAVVLTNNSLITPSDLPDYVFASQNSIKKTIPRLRDAIIAKEKEVILSALNETGWNISQASALLGVYRQFLQKKIKTLSLSH